MLKRLIKWLDDSNWNEYEETTVSKGSDTLKLLDSYNVNTLFNVDNQLHKAYYDYPINSKIKIKDVIEGEYVYENQTQNIQSSVYDDLDDKDTVEHSNNIDLVDSIELIGDENQEHIQSGGFQIIGFHNLPNKLGKIISTVPICKIANIIQWVK